MSGIYRDRAFCARSAVDLFGEVGCLNRECDRFADRHVIAQAAQAQMDIGWADLQTSKCGFVPVEAK